MSDARLIGQLDLFADAAEPSSFDPSASAAGASTAAPAVTAEALAVSLPAAPKGLPLDEVAERITDAGEELVANRRNRGKVGMEWSDLAGLNDALRVKETVKGNVWIKPDYQQLIDDGMPPLVAHVVKQVYDSVAAKPAMRSGVSISDAQLQMYVETVARIEKGVMAWAQDRDALKDWVNRNMVSAGAMLGHRVALSDLTDSRRLLDQVFPDGWKKHQVAVRMVGGNKLLGALQPGYDEVKRAIKAIDDGWPRKREAWEVQGYKVVENPTVSVDRDLRHRFLLSVNGRWISTHETEQDAEVARAAVKPFALFGKRGFVASFDTEALAVEEAKNRSTKSKGNTEVVGAEGISVLLAERVGPSRRMEGEDISSEQLMSEFGFRGVNFGNWMKTSAARAEAQMHLNHAYDALHDLAEILAVPPKALSLGGMLGLAFGAQGRGGANAAHFVPGVNEINLTRTAGAGALAHEFGHAIDHYFARQAGLDTAEAPYLSEHADLPADMTRHQIVDGKMVPVSKPRFGAVRAEILQGFKALDKAMTKREETAEEAASKEARAMERLQKNVTGWLASIRRDFKGLEDQFDVLADRVRAGDLGDGKVQAGPNTILSPVVAEMRDLFKAKHGRVYSLDPVKGLQSNLDSLTYRRDKEAHLQSIAANSAKAAQVTTDYVLKAMGLDKDKGGKPYWATKRELFARAFDSYVADRLARTESRNSYLSFGVRDSQDVPVGRDREAINAAFDTLIGEFAVRESEMGPALFSTAGVPPAGQSMERAAIEREVGEMRGKWVDMPPVYVVDRVQDLPFDALAGADGALYDGKVYLVAENIYSSRQVQKVMAHECVLHHSLEQMLGAYGFAKLHHGVQSLKAKGDAAMVALAEDVRSRYGDLPADIETKEIVARAGEKCLDDTGNIRVEYGFMKSVFAGVAGWLRDHGIKIPFTNVELQGILHSSGQWARTGKTQGTSHGAEGLIKRAGHFVGKILGVSDGVVTQRVHRSGQTALHSVAALDAPVVVGDIADIHYVGGRGHVKTQQRELGR